MRPAVSVRRPFPRRSRDLERYAEPTSVDFDLLVRVARRLGVPAYRWTGAELERLA